MAKWGEGDPRWIVEERADATNVNNWHWYVPTYLLKLIYFLLSNSLFKYAVYFEYISILFYD